MDAAIRQSSTALSLGRTERHGSLLHLLRDQPFTIHFFQAVRLLEKALPGRMPVGYFCPPHEEVVRFSSRTSFDFPASEIHAFQGSDTGPNEMEVNFLGLTTINGPLPHPYAEHLLERIRVKDFAMRDFFDLFNHRLVALFYRSWKRYRFYVGYELADARGCAAEDPVTMGLYSLIGFGTDRLLNRTSVPDEALLYYAGLVGRTVPTVQSLKQLLIDYFEVPVCIDEFVGSWNILPQEDLTCLHGTELRSECLGVGTVVGDAVWDELGTLTIRLGPMPHETYRDFLPGGHAARQLEAWLRLYGQGEFDFVVQLVLARQEVPGVLMASNVKHMVRLGYESWLRSQPMAHDPADAMYRIY